MQKAKNEAKCIKLHEETEKGSCCAQWIFSMIFVLDRNIKPSFYKSGKGYFAGDN